MFSYYSARINGRKLFLIDPGPQIFKVLDLCVLAVGHLREEDRVESLRVEVLFVTWVLEVVHAWPRILLARQIVLSGLVWLENLPLNLARLKVRVRVPHLDLLCLGVIGSWSNSVLSKT